MAPTRLALAALSLAACYDDTSDGPSCDEAPSAEWSCDEGREGSLCEETVDERPDASGSWSCRYGSSSIVCTDDAAAHAGLADAGRFRCEEAGDEVSCTRGLCADDTPDETSVWSCWYGRTATSRLCITGIAELGGFECSAPSAGRMLCARQNAAPGTNGWTCVREAAVDTCTGTPPAGFQADPEWTCQPRDGTVVCTTPGRTPEETIAWTCHWQGADLTCEP